MIIGGKEFNNKDTYIMGILNITPDSFSDGGHYNNIDDALKRAVKMAEDGAHILDIGGESTRPGCQKVIAQEEIERVMPIIEKIKANVDLPISLDTYKAEVAKEGIKCGVALINDVGGLKCDPNIAGVIAEGNVACCLMQGYADVDQVMNADTNDADVVRLVNEGLQVSVDMALAAGVKKEQIILDPGVGFGKDTHQNLIVLNNLDKFSLDGYPVLLGCSRKSVIGNTLNLPVDDRLNGTLATTAMAVMRGCNFVRVHDVRENVHVVKMMNEMLATIR